MHERHIEGDLHAEYRIDLRDLWRPHGGASRLTWRLLGVLLDRLPGDSAYKTAVRDALPDERLAELAAQPRKGHGPWTREAFLLAEVVDRVGHVAYRLGAYDKVLATYPRPGVVAGGRRVVPAETVKALRALAQAHADTHGYELEGTWS